MRRIALLLQGPAFARLPSFAGAHASLGFASLRGRFAALRAARRPALRAGLLALVTLLACSGEAGESGNDKTASGLEITHVVVGTGPHPKATDTVRVHYHGTFPDGRVFDSSVDRGQPASFPLNRVIPCWTEGVQLMKVGGKAKLVCPPVIAYGAGGAPPRIPPNSTLHFEVELLEIQ